MKHSTKRIFSIFLSAIFIIAALIIFAGFIKPAYKTITEKRSEVMAREKILAEAETVISQVKPILSDYQNLSELQGKISLSLPQDPSLASALYQLFYLGSNSGLSIESINVLESPVSPSAESGLFKGTGTLSFVLKTIGSYEALELFLAKAETNLRIFDLEILKIEKAGEKTPNIFNFNIGVNTYYLSS